MMVERNNESNKRNKRKHCKQEGKKKYMEEKRNKERMSQ